MVIKVLAAARLTRLITADSITQPARDWIMPRNSYVSALVQCRSCTSVWVSLGVVLIGHKFPRIMRALAVSESVILLGEQHGN